jgi:hypothetical protein
MGSGTVQFCERRPCAWIVEPSNAWSSLASVVLGVVMLLRARLGGRVVVGVAVALARIFFGSCAIWVTDITGLLCDPDNHLITGHVIWHVLNKTCIWQLGAFYRARLR